MSYDEAGNYLGFCSCYPKPGEVHMFGDIEYVFKEYMPDRGNGTIRLIFSDPSALPTPPIE